VAEREPTATVPTLLDTPEWRVDGVLKVTGRATYAADVRRPGMLWASFRHSDMPHARIVAVDVGEARAVAGVHAVITGADVGPARFGRRLFDQPALAVDRVRFVGERVAAVAAETREAAEEAAQAISIEYEELPVVLDVEAALSPTAPLLHERAEGYVYLGGTRPSVPHGNIQGRRVVGKAQDGLRGAFASAARVFEHEFTLPREHHGYIEPHATMVWIADDGVVHVVSTNKTPFSLRNQMAIAFGLDPATIDVDTAPIGGDFGGKGYTPDEFACYVLARETRRPVKSVSTYVEELGSMSTRHAARVRLRTGVDADGRFVAHEARLLFDGGAYAAAKPLPDLVLPGATETMAPYRIPCVSIEALTIYTNTAPGGHMRSPGEVQAVFAGESHVDAIARELGRDPVEFRLANALRSGEPGPGGELYREARVVEVLEAVARAMSDAPAVRPGPERLGRSARSPTSPVARGRGVAVWGHHVGFGKTSLRAGLDEDGVIRVTTSVPDQGAGGHTVIQRVVASVLSVPVGRVRVERASTAVGLEDAGVGASRVTHITSRAAAIAAERLKTRIEEAASRSLRNDGRAMRLVDGRLVSEGNEPDDRQFDLTEAAPRLIAASGPIDAEGNFEARPHTRGEAAGDHDFAACVVLVDVDTETGRVSIVDATLVADVGTVLNPVAHHGQLIGGFAFGIGAALMEELVLDDGRAVTLNLGDYKLPTAMDMPHIRTVLLPTPVGPGAFGAKMVGELANAGVAPAIANAVADAVGVRSLELPLKAEAIYRAISSGRANQSTSEGVTRDP
jgi:CO/xanthine dehydrogenase Mo-binding subunit